MFERFRKYLEDRITIADTAYELIASVSRIEKLKKRDSLLREGEVCRFNAFVCQGLLRRYSISDKGIEHTVYFAMENWWIADRQSLMDGTPSRYNIDAIEDAVVLLISKTDFDMLCEKIPEFKDMVNQILQRSLNATQERMHTTLQATAEERYMQFLKTFPNVANRASRTMLASYLGITPETLSRIRRQIASH